MAKNAEGEYHGSVQVSKITLNYVLYQFVCCVYVYVYVLIIIVFHFWEKNVAMVILHV